VLFLGITVPDLFPENEDRVELGRSLHFWLSYAFMAFVILHGVDQRKVVLALWRRWKNFVANLWPQPDEH
jgi:cytochrome b561